MVRRLILYCLGLFGLEIRKIPTLTLEIQRGKYRWIQSMDINTVIDVGANIGQFAIIARELFPQARIYSFEPLESCFSQLQKNAKAIGNIFCYNYALGEVNGTSEIFHNEFDASSSLLQMSQLHKDAFPFTKNAEPEMVEVRSFDAIVKELDLKGNVLVKIDVQGFEMNVLKGAEISLNKFDILIVETSFRELYDQQPLFPEILEYMIQKGFEYRGNFDQAVSAISGEVLQSDAIFVRKK